MRDPSITELLYRHRRGDDRALNELAARVYPQLKILARRRAGGGDMGATTLVQETFAKLLAGQSLAVEDRGHLFSLAATVMRQIVIDEARASRAARRQHEPPASLDEQSLADESVGADFLLNLDRALTALHAEDERLSRAFECRYFVGLTTTETAEALGVSTRSAERFWRESRRRLGELLEQ